MPLMSLSRIIHRKQTFQHAYFGQKTTFCEFFVTDGTNISVAFNQYTGM